jgi:hypothetical protein
LVVGWRDWKTGKPDFDQTSPELDTKLGPV